jgi:hypothetical protein
MIQPPVLEVLRAPCALQNRGTSPSASTRAAVPPCARHRASDIARPCDAGVGVDVRLIIEAEFGEGQFGERLQRMGLARRNDEIVRWSLIEHYPHGNNIVTRPTEVALQ